MRIETYFQCCFSSGKPSAPSKPRIDDIEATHMIISWKSPSYDGGAQITGYIVEYGEISSTTWKSIKIKGFSHTSVIKHLKESHTYMFRVAAENIMLESAVSVSLRRTKHMVRKTLRKDT